MTAARLEHLANLVDEAARYFRRTNPAWSHTMAVAARTARIMGAHEARAEATQHLHAGNRSHR
jgi:hypothetical protein